MHTPREKLLQVKVEFISIVSDPWIVIFSKPLGIVQGVVCYDLPKSSFNLQNT